MKKTLSKLDDTQRNNLLKQRHNLHPSHLHLPYLKPKLCLPRSVGYTKSEDEKEGPEALSGNCGVHSNSPLGEN